MKKPWQKNLETVLGVLVGNIVLAFTVAAFRSEERRVGKEC